LLTLTTYLNQRKSDKGGRPIERWAFLTCTAY
jgi:hypothetical protein